MASKGQKGVQKSTGNRVVYDGAQWVLDASIQDVTPDPEPTGRPKWTENIWGKGEIDTWGEDVGAAIGSGLERGAAGIVGLPGAIGNTMNDLRVKLGGMDSGVRLPGIPEAMAAADRVTGPMGGVGVDYEPQGLPGEFAQTVAEFVPGLAMPGSYLGSAGKTVVGGALIPGLASEAAGQVTEGGALEPWARGAAAMLAPAGVRGVRNAVSGGPVNPTRQASVDVLRSKGVEPTAGQVTGRSSLLYAEDATQQGKAALDKAMKQYTQAAVHEAIPNVLKPEVKLTPGATATQQMDELFLGVGKVMDNLAANNSVTVDQSFRSNLATIASKYDNLVGAGGRSKYFANFAKDAKNIDSLSGADYQRIRTELGLMSKSPDQATREAARATMDVLDNGMETSIRNRGNLTDVERYTSSRAAYRNAITLEKALAKAPGRGSDARITPSSLATAAKSQDVRSWVRGGTHYDDLARAGEDVLDMPRSSGSAERGIAETMGNVTMPGGLGMAIGTMIGGPAGAPIGAGLGAAAPMVRNRAVGSQAGQGYLKRTTTAPMRRAPSTAQATGLLPMLGYDNNERR